MSYEIHYAGNFFRAITRVDYQTIIDLIGKDTKEVIKNDKKRSVEIAVKK